MEEVLENEVVETVPEEPASAPEQPEAVEPSAPVGDESPPAETPVLSLEGDELEGGLDSSVGVLGEIVEVEEPRLFLTTPFEDYTVTEGFLLLIVVLLVVGFLWRLVWEVF